LQFSIFFAKKDNTNMANQMKNGQKLATSAWKLKPTGIDAKK
jgi:hypothetical protein